MTNFEKLKSEIEVNDFANKRYIMNDTQIKNDVGTYKIPENATSQEKANIFARQYNDELLWLKSEVKD